MSYLSFNRTILTSAKIPLEPGIYKEECPLSAEGFLDADKVSGSCICNEKSFPDADSLTDFRLVEA
jgi:hypothetical protein